MIKFQNLNKMKHSQPHPLAGKTVTIKATSNLQNGRINTEGPLEYRVEDYWDRVSGKSWMVSNGSPAAMSYGFRTGLSNAIIPTDDEVLYGKIEGMGTLVHITEIENNQTFWSMTGQDLKRLRLSKNWKQEALASELGSTQSVVSRMEGGYSPITSKMKERIEKVFADCKPIISTMSSFTDAEVINEAKLRGYRVTRLIAC